MYIRSWIRSKDEHTLIDIATQNFDVRTETIQGILEQANEVLVICKENGMIAGFLSYRFRINDMVLVDYVVLDNHYQGKGIARHFLPSFEGYLLKKGIQKVYGTVDRDNREAIAAFKSMGFENIGRFASNLIIEKNLSRSKSIT
ncbi:GNAT family N-acetyltransferase [Alkalihalobacillus sp. AL-G]|uniref:GNAT family N-acetyltransferase n=1 Tax=Alkalihalobacillus sp. AL-G TaxID=2926399 RepID=UPI00272B07F8|nr:GNAT family N-acetyltransferase [Alkalihalobacillus sp. AL-G]WLD94580.1 GNAT family N-acetyltransferase [Alkalihalobacillus sp. AL-G]